jgi:hypothetical protein
VIFRLMRKDLLLNRSMAAFAVAGVVLLTVLLSFGAGTQRIDGVPLEVVIFLATFTGSLLATFFAGRDDRYRTGTFSLALPVTRCQVVLSRYLFSLFALPLWVGLTALTRWACRPPAFPSDVFTPGNLVLALSALVAGMSVNYPLVAAVGFPGLLYGLLGPLVLTLFAAASARLFPAVRPVLGTLGRIGPLLGRLHALLGDPRYLLAVVGSLLFLCVLSFAAAGALSRRKEA